MLVTTKSSLIFYFLFLHLWRPCGLDLVACCLFFIIVWTGSFKKSRSKSGRKSATEPSLAFCIGLEGGLIIAYQSYSALFLEKRMHTFPVNNMVPTHTVPAGFFPRQHQHRFCSVSLSPLNQRILRPQPAILTCLSYFDKNWKLPRQTFRQ